MPERDVVTIGRTRLNPAWALEARGGAGRRADAEHPGVGAGEVTIRPGPARSVHVSLG